MYKKSIVSLLICCILLASAYLGIASAASQVTLTAQTDSSLYNRYTPVTYIGSMAYNSYVNIIYPSDAIVGLEIKDPSGATMVTRSIRTGDALPAGLSANIDSAYLCDSSGNPITSIPLPTSTNQVTPTYYIHVTNNLNSIQSMLLTLTIFDSNGVPIAWTFSNVPGVGPYTSSYVRANFLIQPYAHFGTAYAYVSAFTDSPSKGGVPIALEKTFQFTITGGTPFSGTPPTTNSLNGIKQYYNFTYRLPKTCGIGTYTTYTTANYQGVSATQTSTFQVKQFGDLNGDGVDNFEDIGAFVSGYIYCASNHVMIEAINFHDDNVINFLDVQDFVGYYVYFWSS